VTLSKRIWLVGTNNPVIDARGKTNGVLITGGGAAGATVRGFKVQNANFEGILAQRTSSVTIARNTVQQNDQGLKSSHPTGECAAAGPIPGDCGEGVHLLSVTLASVSNNTVQDNAGGILLTDELGPTAFNVISGNKALNNVLDCGITLASHNVKAAPGGVPQPSAAGVYDNYIVNNTANGNGTKGEGGGILIAGPAPGTASYNNVVNGNTANDNGLAGITLHSHTPQQDFNGNVITNNRVSHDGISGNNGGPGDSDFGVKNTVGILLGSTVDTLQGTVVANNTISNVFFGIWTMNVPKINTPNTFIGVTAPLTQT
jgi:parallel beta-helix repeat protein